MKADCFIRTGAFPPTVRLLVGGKALEAVFAMEKEMFAAKTAWAEYADRFGASKTVFDIGGNREGRLQLAGIQFPSDESVPEGFRIASRYQFDRPRVFASPGPCNKNPGKRYSKEIEKLPSAPGSFSIGDYLETPDGLRIDQESGLHIYHCGCEKLGDLYVLVFPLMAGQELPPIPEGCVELKETEYLALRRKVWANES